MLFSRQGSVRPRPSQGSRDGNYVSYDSGFGSPAIAGTSLFSFDSLNYNYPIQGPAVRCTPQGSTVLLAGNGKLAYGSQSGVAADAQWTDAGPAWSVRVTRKPALNAAAFTLGYACSQGLTNYRSAGGGTYLGYPHYTSDWQLQGTTPEPSTFSTTVAAVPVSLSYATGPVVECMVWVDSANNVKVGVVAPTWPSWVETTLATDWGGGTTAMLWACQGAVGGTLLIAYVPSASTHDVKILKVTVNQTTGNATSSNATFVLANPVTSLCIASDGTHILLAATLTTTGLTSKVITQSTLTDAGIDITPGGTAQLAVCGIGNGLGYYACNLGAAGGNGGLPVYVRNLTAAAGNTACLLPGNSSGSPNLVIQWFPLFPPTEFGGRVVMGAVMNAGTQSRGTWVVFDVQQPAGWGYASPVAVGLHEGTNSQAPPGACSVDAAGNLHFVVNEGITYNTNGVETACCQPIVLTAQAPRTAETAGLTYLNGSVTHAFDGAQTFEVGYLTLPYLNVTTGQGGSGTMASGSYTLQALWEWTDAQQNLHRSPASLPVTTTVSGGPDGYISWVVNVPVTLKQYATIAVYCSQVNPSSTAPLYLAATVTTATWTAGTAVVTGTINAVPALTADQLYTVGGIINDDRPASSDRGIAVMPDRVWTADERTLYASKTLRATIAPAWNSGFYQVQVPRALGAVRSLEAMSGNLFVFCTNGVAVVSGSGLDDFGNGTGWTPPQMVYPVGAVSYSRSSAPTPAGPVFLGRDGLLHQISLGLSGAPIGEPVDALYVNGTDADVVFAAPGLALPSATASRGAGATNALIAIGPLLDASNSATPTIAVLDTVTGQWSTWSGGSLQGATRLAAVDHQLGGVVWAYDPTAPALFSFDSWTFTDQPSNAAQVCKIVTRPVRLGPGNSALGWGRVRSCSVNRKVIVGHTLNVQLIHGDTGTVVTNKTTTEAVPTGDGNWPYDYSWEFRASGQRASSVSVALTATGGGSEWSDFELWVSQGNERAPTLNRS